MKKHSYTFAALILIFITLVAWWSWPRKILEQQSEKADAEHIATSELQTNQTPSVKPNFQPVPRPANLDPSVTEEVWQYVQKIKADATYDWKQPIEFYGKVVDENGQAVEGASADFKWTDLSPNGTSEYHTESDAAGLFSMTNQKGKRLSVTASKPGYYSTADARLASFEYANPADGLFTPDASKPVIFHLKKKGAGTDLITSQYGVKPYLGVTAPLDGSRVSVDLLERKFGDRGHIIVSQIKPAYEGWKQATEWEFRMEVTDGGFVEHHDEFSFEAPNSGYEPVVEFKFQTSQTNWTTSLRKDYYIKFGNPSRYGWLHIDTSIMTGNARFTYAINPDGSRYLEPKEAALSP